MLNLVQRIRVIDTETTGFEEPIGVVEIGFTDLLLDNGQWDLGETRSILVNPGRRIQYGAMAVHHIRDEHVAGEPPLPDILPPVLYDVEIFAAHNASFDRKLVDTRGRPWICTYKCAKELWPSLDSYSNGAIRYELDLVPDEWEHRTHPSHRAGPDTFVTALILQRLLTEATIETLIAITEQPIRLKEMPFGKHKGQSFDSLPSDYLDWIVNKSDMAADPESDVAHTARLELRRRSI